MGFFENFWNAINSINFNKQMHPGGAFIGGSNYINRNTGPKPTPRPPALGERDALSNFRQGERDSYSRSMGGSQFPSMQEIMARLEQLSNPGRYMASESDLINQARAAASAQYDPVISQLRNQMKSTEGRANKDKVALGQMFGQLSESLGADIPKIQQTFAGTKQNTQQEYDTLKKRIEGTYSDTQADQEAMLKRLNIEAAAPDILPEQMRDRDYFTNLAQKEGQTAQTALGMEERGATEYTRRGTELARTEGVQRQSNLMDQLRSVLEAYEQQIGSNEAAKAQATSAGLGQLRSQAMEQAMGFSQRDFDNYLKTIGMGRDLRSDELNTALKGQVTKVNSPADVAGRALNLGFGGSDAQTIQDVFMTAIGSDDIILSGLNPTSGTTAPKEALAARIVEEGRARGLSQQQLNALQTIALEYFGRS